MLTFLLLLLLRCRWVGVSRYTDHRHNIDDILVRAVSRPACAVIFFLIGKPVHLL
jgi:hypothetical protein